MGVRFGGPQRARADNAVCDRPRLGRIAGRKGGLARGRHRRVLTPADERRDAVDERAAHRLWQRREDALDPVGRGDLHFRVERLGAVQDAPQRAGGVLGVVRVDVVVQLLERRDALHVDGVDEDVLDRRRAAQPVVADVGQHALNRFEHALRLLRLVLGEHLALFLRVARRLARRRLLALATAGAAAVAAGLTRRPCFRI
mmetsp:Transcript_9524/g.29449  ORF Transcript_9524/g.29449 Transcript_9524/m.29449 type:complete len:200 (+) Transcript_9524:2001-2600(+)